MKHKHIEGIVSLIKLLANNNTFYRMKESIINKEMIALALESCRQN